MAKTKLEIINPPSYIYVGETVGLQVETDADDYEVSLSPTYIVDINEAKDKITARQEGRVTITLKARRNLYESTTTSIDILVLIEDKKASSIMFHNRETNRISKLISPVVDNNKDPLEIKLPDSDVGGTLLTHETISGAFQTIVKPVILDPKTGDIDCYGWITATDYNTSMGYQGEHEGTIWEYALDQYFSNKLLTKTIINGDKTKGPIPYAGLTIWVRCKYVSYNVESEWSEPVQFTCKNNITQDNKPTLAKGDYMCGYFGEIPHSECIDNRDYRGNYPTLIANNLKDFTPGQMVHKGDTLYYALKTMNANLVFDPEVSVADGNGYWAVDERNDLPTVRWVNDIIGVGLGINDSSTDGYSTGSTEVGHISNMLDGWIKYVYKGRVCYMPKKPISTQICWNDIAKNDVMYGEKTFRGGASQLYRIRLMREEEYLEVIPKLMNGQLANYTQLDLGLMYETNITTNANSSVYSAINNIYVDCGAEYGERDNIYTCDMSIVGHSKLEQYKGNEVKPFNISNIKFNANNVKTFFQSAQNIFFREYGDEYLTDYPETIYLYFYVSAGGTANVANANWKTSCQVCYEGTNIGHIAHNFLTGAVSNAVFNNGKVSGNMNTHSRGTNEIQVNLSGIESGFTFRPFYIKVKLTNITEVARTVANTMAYYTTQNEVTFISGTMENAQKVKIRLRESWRQGTLTWLEDFQEGANRKVGDHTGTKIYQTDPKTRIGTLITPRGISKWYMCYRPVIEVITDSDEPWRNTPYCPKAPNENFRYDKYTDTGYFGRLPYQDFIRGDTLANDIAFTNGSLINSLIGWYKFYWHGIIVYMPTDYIKSYTYYAHMVSNGIAQSFDTGGRNNKIQKINGVTFSVGVPKWTRYRPFGGNSKIQTLEYGLFSHSTELIYRISKVGDKKYYNAKHSNDPDGTPSFWYLWNGYQRGDNWEENDIANWKSNGKLGDYWGWYGKENVYVMSYFGIYNNEPERMSSPRNYGNDATNSVDYDDCWYPVLYYRIQNHKYLTRESVGGGNLKL